MRTFTIEPRGPFDLATARDFAGGFAAGIGSRATTEGSILMTFPVEGWAGSAVVQVRQDTDGSIRGQVFGDGDLETIERQAARSLSLDHDGSGWPAVGQRDPIVGRLQERYGLLRPVCFFSAYEAATSFVIGQRISMAQTRRVKQRLAEEAGDAVEIELDGERRTIQAFPRPPLGDRISREAVRHFYELPDVPEDDAWLTIAEGWRPYRMWATVLLHMAWRREQPAMPSYRQDRRDTSD